jgi:tRNA U34 5-carboxymethylaminomethyl modifying GTPase MnmE/TrmE
VVVNKCDLRRTYPADADAGGPPGAGRTYPAGADAGTPPGAGGAQRGSDAGWVEVSAKTHEGLDKLREAIAERIGAVGVRGSAEVIVTNARHQQALERTGEAVGRALGKLEAGASEEYIAQDLRAALETLGEITGVTSREEIIAEIFGRFCVGK